MAQRSSSQENGKLHFAVVGAGVAGLTCARELLARGSSVTVFERSGVVGGRLASVQTDAGVYDVGAQYVTVQQESFANEVRHWISANLLRTWDASLAEMSAGQATMVTPPAPRFVGVPCMQSIASYLARGLHIVFNAEVGRIARGSSEWYLFDPDERQLGIVGFDGLVLAIPSIDALPLVRSETDFAARLETVRWDACWMGSLELSRPSGIEFDSATITDDPILAWVARENSKPMRRLGGGVAEIWLLQARSTWSNNFVELAPDDAARWMQRAFAARLARPLAQKSCSALRWRNATPVEAFAETFLWDPARAVGLAGDWCGGARVETAFVSGLALAQAIAG
jgi:predicted NAD/FAD-dependent oxidoreductase